MTKPPDTSGLTEASQETVRTIARLQSDLDLAKAENVRLREALKDAAAHLIGAASAYRKYARRYKVRGESDPFFTTRANDFDKAGERAREALKDKP